MFLVIPKNDYVLDVADGAYILNMLIKCNELNNLLVGTIGCSDIGFKINLIPTHLALHNDKVENLHVVKLPCHPM